MDFNHLSSDQEAIVNGPPAGRTFLFGPAGTGKTTAGVARLFHLVESGVPADQILILVPQRTLARPYFDLLRHPDFPAGGTADVVTLGGLGQRMIRLFWPVIASQAGFANPNQPPTFLTLETSQYYMARLVSPLIDQGYFETIHLDRNRIYSQILDNLNKSAAVGFDHTQIAERLKAAWIGKPEQTHAYEEAQDCANRFREYCLQNNLLDFSLQLEVFLRHLWPSFLCREYLFASYRHLIFDNVEEDVPVVHEIIAQWLSRLESALLIYDTEAGYRLFLGADPDTGWALQDTCNQAVSFSKSWITQAPLDQFRAALGAAVSRQEINLNEPIPVSSVEIARQPFYPQLLDWVCAKISWLIIERRVPPGEIAVLAPFLSDALRFSLMDRLERAGIPSRSHRPSRSLREEPATHCLLTLARLAHPQWKLVCSHYDVRMALMQSIQDLDLVRADVLARIVYRASRFDQGLVPFDRIRSETQERISYVLGQRYEDLRLWIEDYLQGEPAELDIFLSRLFGEVLSQDGFGFHQNLDGAGVVSRLIESIQKFRWAASETLTQEQKPVGLEYIQMVSEGVIAAQYLQAWQDPSRDAVFIAPAYTYLMSNQPVSYQFWLDVGSLGWWERLYQPLTHPIVLSRHWPPGRMWTDADENATNLTTLERLVSGLIRRCRQGIFLCTSGLNERGDEPRGPLLQAIQMIKRRGLYLEDSNVETA